MYGQCLCACMIASVMNCYAHLRSWLTLRERGNIF